jgi:hypothetical protein
VWIIINNSHYGEYGIVVKTWKWRWFPIIISIFTTMQASMSSVMSSKGVRWIGLGWTGFILENLILSHNREEIIGTFGSSTYHNVYNTLSTLACSSIAWGYFKHGRKTGPKLIGRSKAALAVGLVSQTVGLVCLSQLAPKLQVPVAFTSEAGNDKTDQNTTAASKSYNSTVGDKSNSTESKKFAMRVRCPMDFKAVDAPADGIYGLERISRHCVFWSFGMLCMGQACYALYVPEIVMFSFPLVFAIIGTEHQDYRFRRGSGGMLTPQYEQVTSNIPFAALVMGKQSWDKLFDEMKWTNASVAACLAAVRFMRLIR